MNLCLIAAGTLAFLVGLVHSVLGETLIFRRLRTHGWIPTNGGKLLGERHVRILWASWHVLTVLGWALAALLLWLAFQAAHAPFVAVVASVIAVSTLASAVVVGVGTRLRHPGWLGLLGVALLTALGTDLIPF